MKRIVLGVLMSIVVSLVAVCGALELSWSSQFHVLDDQIARAAVLTSDGYYVLAGDGNSRAEAVLIKTAANPVWERVYSATFARMFSSVIELTDGGIVAGGSAFYSGYAGDENAWLVKVDRQGDTIWEMQYGSTSEQNDVYAMAATSDGGFIVSALRLPHAGGAAVTWLLKLDANGHLVWEKTYPTGIGLSILQTADGGYVISGRQDIAQSFYSYVWALRVDAQGTPIWEQVYTDLEIYVQLANQVVAAPNGDYVIVGKEFVLRIDPSGQVVWNRPFPNRLLDTAAFTDDGKLVVGGSYNDYYFFDHLYVALLSDDGSTTYWEDIELLYNSSAAQVMPDPYGGIAVAGWVQTDPSTIDMILALFRE
jgi:hypothetical protein